MKKILIIEDDDPIRMALEDDFKLEGFQVVTSENGPDGLNRAKDPELDLIILDIMLPGMNGFEICKHLRSHNIKTPIIMLTAKGQEVDRILGLEFGADDYMTKPFSPRELQARVRAVLRRTGTDPTDHEENYFRHGDFEVDFLQYKCRVGEHELNLTAYEFALLKYLIRNRGRVVERDEILDEVWGKDIVVSIRTIDTHMANLRKKIEKEHGQSGLIKSIRGVGYIFTAGGNLT